MKRKLIYILLFLFPVILMAQSPNQNWVKTKIYRQPTLDIIQYPSAEQASVQVNYFDGLGRPIQSIKIGQSATGNDIINHIEYDALGRQDKEYLPYTDGTISLDYRDTAKVDLIQYYQGQEYDFTRTDSQEINPYSQKQFEASPLNRVLKQAAPGGKWALGEGHEIKFDYKTNTANEVKLFTFTTDYNSATKIYDIVEESLATGNYYEANQLYKSVTKDENNTTNSSNQTIEYKNKLGQVVLKRVRASINARTTDNTQNFDTYYIYDDFGNLTFVLPPLVNTNQNITPTILNELCYQYKYDYRNRLVAKKIPGKQWEFIVYDRLDRVRAIGPVASPFSDITESGRIITVYDAFNRPIYTAWVQGLFDETMRTALENTLNNATQLSEVRQSNKSTVNGVSIQYSRLSDTSNYHILTVNYYDDYNYNYPVAPTNIVSTIFGHDVRNGSTDTYNGLKTLPTGSWVRILEESTEKRGNLSYSLYKADRLSSPIRTIIEYPNGGYTKTDSEIDFEGKVLKTVTSHLKDDSTDSRLVTTIENFTYSEQGRLITNTHKVDSDPTENIVSNIYKELGELASKNVGGTNANNPLQKVDYTYNIRGWLTAINDINNLTDTVDDLFAFKINYNTTEDSETAQLFNGNISETFWRTNADNMTRKYSYDYDGLNRLLQANYRNVDSDIDATYNEALTYDKNGNIQSLLRNGGFENQTYTDQIDNLSYFYQDNSNQLKKVIDATNSTQGFRDRGNNMPNATDSPDYEFDDYGNMTQDQNKNINLIIYNHLNLPTEIQFTQNRTIKYKYDATGVKLQKEVFDGIYTTITDYLNGYQYEDKHIALLGFGESRLLFFPHAEGYVKPVFAQDKSNKLPKYQYVYAMLDHLNNVRITYSKVDGQLKVLEENNYYPGGHRHSSYNQTKKKLSRKITNDLKTATPTIRNPYQYKYNNTEYQDEFDINMYDLGARMYDPLLWRMPTIDPRADEYHSQSPYAFAVNNPVYYIDINGEGVEWKPQVNENGSTSYVAEENDTVATFASQYGVTLDQAQSLVGTNNVKAGETSVSGQSVLNMNPYNQKVSSEVLTLDLNSDRATSQRVFDQFIFSRDHATTKGDNVTGFIPADYFSNYNLNRGINANANFTIDGTTFNVNFTLNLHRITFWKDKTRNVYAYDTSPTTTKPATHSLSLGKPVPSAKMNIIFDLLHPAKGHKIGEALFRVQTKNETMLYNRLGKTFPQFIYSYPASSQSIKN